MITYEETKDPDATRIYTHDWTDALQNGETITAVTVVMIASAGCTQPLPASFSGNVTRTYLSGGAAGGECIFEVRLTTSNPGSAPVEGFGVVIAEASAVPNEADEIRQDITLLKAARRSIIEGKTVREVARAGRRMVFQTDGLSLAEIEAAITRAERKLAEAENYASSGTRRAPISLAWQN